VFWWTTNLQVDQVSFLCHNPSLVYHALATWDNLNRHVCQSYTHIPSFPFFVPFILRCLQHTRCGCSVLNLGLSLNTHPRQFSSLVIIFFQDLRSCPFGLYNRTKPPHTYHFSWVIPWSPDPWIRWPPSCLPLLYNLVHLTLSTSSYSTSSHPQSCHYPSLLPPFRESGIVRLLFKCYTPL